MTPGTEIDKAVQGPLSSVGVWVVMFLFEAYSEILEILWVLRGRNFWR